MHQDECTTFFTGAITPTKKNSTERPSTACEVSANFYGYRGVAWSARRIPTAVNLRFLDRSRYFLVEVAPHLSSQGLSDPVPDPLLLRKSGSAGNRPRDLWVCNQDQRSPDHRGSSQSQYPTNKQKKLPGF
jgi:hypothetical protein